MGELSAVGAEDEDGVRLPLPQQVVRLVWGDDAFEREVGVGAEALEQAVGLVGVLPDDGEEPDAVDFGRDGEAEEQQQDDGHDEHDGDRARVAQEVEHLFPDE